jgi:D-alanine-D-alanine ligase
MKKIVAVVAGGDSSESVISVQSAETVIRHLDSAKYEAFTVMVSGADWKVIDRNRKEYGVDKNDFSFQKDNEKIKFELAFIAIHGTPGEDGILQAYFDLLKIPYTSCGLLASALTFNKYHCNVYLKGFGINVAKSVLVKKADKIAKLAIVEEIGLPCFVKPNAGGSSFGISKVKKIEELVPAIEKARQESPEVIIEEFISGTEVTCGVVKTKNKDIVFPLTEIVSKTEFFDYQAKYDAKFSEEITPARVSETNENECKHQASKIYDALGCKGIVRIDFIIRGHEVFMLEVNTVPGMSQNSIIPKQIRAINLTVGEVFDMVINDILTQN